LCFKQTIGRADRDLPGLESFEALPLQGAAYGAAEAGPVGAIVGGAIGTATGALAGTANSLAGPHGPAPQDIRTITAPAIGDAIADLMEAGIVDNRHKA
jgi:hypothetical protein